MTRELLALNHSLMIEMIRKCGKSNDEIINVLMEGNAESFQPFGEGIPDWETFIQYYESNPIKMKNAIYHGFKVTFLTKGALKMLLKIKFNLHEGEDFIDTGETLENMKLSFESHRELQEMISSNWRIIAKQQTSSAIAIKIQLANQSL
ncbi:hypothetical protein [Cytobacillus horneckiae]|uniref:hypothetical protein n=1 Tax=Cytobacillus horneckiae TaxID=549687 RepID=UPI003D2003B8